MTLKHRFSQWLARMVLVLAFTIGVVRYAAGQLYLGEGTWVSDDGAVSGTWKGTIDAAGPDLSGDLTLTGIPGLSEAKIDGNWHDNVIDSALIKWESEVATIVGTIAEPNVSGTFTMPVNVTGTWQGQIALIPDDSTPTPSADDPAPGSDSTATPTDATPTPPPPTSVPAATATDVPAPEASATPTESPPEPTSTPAPPTPVPDVTPTDTPASGASATPTDSPSEPTLTGAGATPTPTP